ncbi:MAG: hypothetical protein DRR19_12605, partial [Candidatus Parabeggiatoa sp. nov. 1]
MQPFKGHLPSKIILLLLGLAGTAAHAQAPKIVLQLGHLSTVLSVAYSPDGQTVVSGSYDKTVKLWEVNTGRLLKTFHGHSSSVTSVAYAPDGQTVLSGSDDKTVKLWSVRTGLLLKTFAGHTRSVTSVAYAPDGQTVVSGSYDKTVKLWEANSG